MGFQCCRWNPVHSPEKKNHIDIFHVAVCPLSSGWRLCPGALTALCLQRSRCKYVIHHAFRRVVPAHQFLILFSISFTLFILLGCSSTHARSPDRARSLAAGGAASAKAPKQQSTRGSGMSLSEAHDILGVKSGAPIEEIESVRVCVISHILETVALFARANGCRDTGSCSRRTIGASRAASICRQRCTAPVSE